MHPVYLKVKKNDTFSEGNYFDSLYQTANGIIHKMIILSLLFRQRVVSMIVSG